MPNPMSNELENQSAGAVEPQEEVVLKKWWGAEEILEVVQNHAEETVRVKTTSGAFDVPTWEYLTIMRESPRPVFDLTDIRNERAIHVVDSVYAMLLNLRVRESELEYIIRKLLARYEEASEKARLELFGVSNAGDITLNLIEEKLPKRITE